MFFRACTCSVHNFLSEASRRRDINQLLFSLNCRERQEIWTFFGEPRNPLSARRFVPALLLHSKSLKAFFRTKVSRCCGTLWCTQHQPPQPFSLGNDAAPRSETSKFLSSRSRRANVQAAKWKIRTHTAFAPRHRRHDATRRAATARGLNVGERSGARWKASGSRANVGLDALRPRRLQPLFPACAQRRTQRASAKRNTEVSFPCRGGVCARGVAFSSQTSNQPRLANVSARKLSEHAGVDGTRGIIPHFLRASLNERVRGPWHHRVGCTPPEVLRL